MWLEELLALSLLILSLFHTPLFEIDFIILLFVTELCELASNELRILDFVIPGQVLRLSLIAKCLALEVFEESFEGVELGSVHGGLLFQISINLLLTVNFLLVVGNPGLDHQGVDSRFLRISREVILDAPAVRVLTGSGLLDLGEGIFGHLCQ